MQTCIYKWISFFVWKTCTGIRSWLLRYVHIGGMILQGYARKRVLKCGFFRYATYPTIHDMYMHHRCHWRRGHCRALRWSILEHYGISLLQRVATTMIWKKIQEGEGETLFLGVWMDCVLHFKNNKQISNNMHSKATRTTATTTTIYMCVATY